MVWTVRVTRVLERPDRAGDVTMQVVNPESGRAWGDPFTMTLPRSFREQLEESPDRHYWELAGTLTATPISIASASCRGSSCIRCSSGRSPSLSTSFGPAN
ncbi:MAG: hypothetical protein R3B46_12270 [Phycisphaerales bacterium]